MDEVADAGAQRVSVGGRLTWVALAAMVAAAEEMRDEGGFAGLAARGGSRRSGSAGKMVVPDSRRVKCPMRSK